MKNITSRQWIGMLVGNFGLAIGVCIFKISGLGNDPFSGMVMSIGAILGLRYGTFLMIANGVFFLFELWKGKKFIGIGTIVNWFLIGYIVDFLYPKFIEVFGMPQLIWQKLLILVLGVLVSSFSVSLYQTANVGISPYDSISLIIQEKTKIPYFFCRISIDTICAIICFTTGGIVGLGTLSCAFGLGPFIAFFNKNFSKKWLRVEEA